MTQLFWSGNKKAVDFVMHFLDGFFIVAGIQATVESGRTIVILTHSK